MSSPSPRSAPAVSRTSDSASAPLARATYRRRSMGCTPSRYRPPGCRSMSPTERPADGSACVGGGRTLLATVAPRGDQPTDGPRAGPARCGAAPARGVVDDVPPRHRRARPVHERELVDPADGDAGPGGPARLGRPRQLPRHGRRARHPRLPRPAAQGLPRLHRPGPHRRQGAGPRRRCRRSCSSASTAPSRPPPRGGRRRRGGPSPTPSPRRRRGARRTSPSSGTPARSTGHPPSADACRARSRSPTSRSSRSSTSSSAALAEPGRVVVAAPPGAGKTTVVPLAALDAPWLGDAAHRHARAAPAGHARRGPADGRPHRARPSATSSATRPATSAASARTTRIEVVTEGVLTRRLQQDPELPGVGLVIFDEVHERNLTTDLGLGVHARRRGDAAPRPAHRGDVGDRRHRPVRPPAGDGRRPGARRRERRAHVPRRRALGAAMGATTAWRARWRAPSGGPCATRPATCWRSCPGIGEISRLADQLIGDLGPDVDVHRWPARCRSRSRTGRWPRRRPAGGGSCWRPTSPRRR